jgi:hypothetical protein
VVWRIGVERRGFLVERASGAEAQGLCSRSPVVAGGRALSWEKLVAVVWRLEVFGVRCSEKRRAGDKLSVFGSRNCSPDLVVLIARRFFNDEFSPSARTAIPHGLRRVSKMMVICV